MLVSFNADLGAAPLPKTSRPQWVQLEAMEQTKYPGAP